MTLADRTRPLEGVTFRERGGTVVAALSPQLSLELADDVVAAIAEAATGAPIVLDVSDLTLTESDGIARLVSAVLDAADDPSRCCVVARRPSSRRLLRQWGIERTVCVFGSVGDAIQARLHAVDGYGPGWTPEPSAS